MINAHEEDGCRRVGLFFVLGFVQFDWNLEKAKVKLSDFKTCPLSMCQFFLYLIHKIDWDFTWIMIQSWSIHVGANQLWGSLRPFLNVLMNV